MGRKRRTEKIEGQKPESTPAFLFVMNQYFKPIDGIRGVLSLYVFLFHFHDAHPFSGAGLQWLNLIFSKGGISLQLFFTLSGFLIINSFLNSIESKTYSPAKFLTRRAFRIFPLLHLVILYRLATGTPFDWHVVTNFFLIFGILPYDYTKLPVFVSWSLFVEEMFYLSMPLMIRFLNLRTSLFGYIVFYFSCRLWYQAVAALKPYSAGMRWDTPFNSFHYFFAGIFIYMAWKEGWFSEKNLSRGFIWLVDFLIALLWGIYFIGGHMEPSLAAMGFLITILTPKSIFFKIWTNPALMWIGVRCYPIYLFHMEVIEFAHKHLLVSNYFPSLQGDLAKFMMIFICFAVLAALADLAHRFIEKPCMNFAKRITT